MVNVPRVFATLIGALLAPTMLAQPPGDQAIIRSETREVQVDVAVRDKQGRSPRDLAAKDFTVLEDGKKQSITSLSLSSGDPGASRNHIVLYFDEIFTEDDTRKDVANFIDAVSGPDRSMAIVSFGQRGARVLQNFTSDTARLKNALRGIQSAGTTIRGTTLAELTKAGNERDLRLLESLRQVAQSLAPAAERKAMILFTTVERSPDNSATFDSLIAACNRANIAVYLSGWYRSDELAKATGGTGLSKGKGSLTERLAAVVREQNEYYHLTYVPPESREGTCHALQVKVNGGFDLRARKEYCTAKALDLVTGNIAGKELETRRGGGNQAASLQLPYFYTGTNRANIHLALDFMPTGIKLEKDHGKLRGQIDVVGIASRPESGVAARFSESIKLDFDNQQQADIFLGRPYHYENQFVAAAGQYTFRVVAGQGGITFVNLETPLVVEPWDSSVFGIGSIALSREAHLASDESSGNEVPSLEGFEPLEAGGMRYAPSGTNEFARTDRIYMYSEVYEPSQGGTHLLRIRILDRRSGEVKTDSGSTGIDSFARAGNPVIAVAATLSVASLPPGSYRLEVIATRSQGPEKGVRTVDFELR